MATRTRKIIHIDCDCFYAAVEMRDNPNLQDKPLAVGGDPARRGVVATCNYLAREYGVRSAMAMALALKKCPQLVVVPPRMSVYREISEHIRDIFTDYTHLIEPLSLDEAYLDVTASVSCKGSATLMAQQIRERIQSELGISASAGIAPNKMLAKIASDWRKPNGQFVVLPAQIDTFVGPLAVSKLHGVGAVTAKKLASLGIQTCADLQTWSEYSLVLQFGRFGQQLYHYARGMDEREVKSTRVRKSISVERTFNQDLPDFKACAAQLQDLTERLQERWVRAFDAPAGDRQSASDQSPQAVIKGVYVKVKFDNFKSTTAERSVVGEFDAVLSPTAYLTSTVQAQLLQELLFNAYARHARAVRLLGIGVRLDVARSAAVEGASQLELF